MYPFRKKCFLHSLICSALVHFRFIFSCPSVLFIFIFLRKNAPRQRNFYRRDRREISLVEVPHFYRHAGRSSTGELGIYFVFVFLFVFLLFHVIIFLLVSFFFSQKKNVKKERKCLHFAKTNVAFSDLFCSCSFFKYFLVPLCCSFSFFFEKAHLASGTSTGEIGGRSCR